MSMEKIPEFISNETEKRKERVTPEHEELRPFEKKEVLVLDKEKLVANEKTFLERIGGKGRNIAEVLTLVTALSLTPDFVHEVTAGGSESQAIERAERRKEEKETKDYYNLEFQEEKEIPLEIIENINLIYFSVVNNGEVKPIILSREDITKNPEIVIDGYIANILIFGKNEMNVQLNQENAKKIEKFENAEYINLAGSAVYPEELVTENYNKDFFQQLVSGEMIKGEEVNYLKGGYFFGQDTEEGLFLGKTASDVEKNQLSFKIGNADYSLPITQKILKEFHETEGVIFRYLGNNLDGFLNIDQLDQKLEAISAAINKVEEIADIDLVDHVDLVDFNRNNASASMEEKLISFLSGYLREYSTDEVKNVTEHEVLHRYVANRGFTENTNIRELFAMLKGYEGRRKRAIVRDGTIPFDDFNHEYDNKVFFAFLNEKNFFNMSGGHSHGNVWEFITSFFHSLMYLDKLENNLESSIRIREGQFNDVERKLSKEEQLNILDNYTTVLQLILQNIKDVPVIGHFYDNKDEKFIKDKLDRVKQVQIKYES